jgi:hypothetical protein
MLLAVSLIWLAPTIACGSFAPRPTPTPTLAPESTPAITDIITSPQVEVTPPTPDNATPTTTPAPAPGVTTTITATATPAATPVPGTALAVGQPARITAPAGLNYRDQPNSGGALLGQFGAGILVTVLEGPVVAEDFTWWRVEDGNGNVGWAAEGDSETTWISPQLGDPQPANRPPNVGERVVVTMPAGGQLSVRSQPGVDAALVTRVNPDQQFTVQAGPQSADGLNWYQIRSDDGTVEGWAAEGDGAERWLSPLE